MLTPKVSKNFDRSRKIENSFGARTDDSYGSAGELSKIGGDVRGVFATSMRAANASRCTRAPVPVLRLNLSVPAKLENIINHAMEKDRDLRYQHASDLRAELQRLNRDTMFVESRGKTQLTRKQKESKRNEAKAGKAA